MTHGSTCRNHTPTQITEEISEPLWPEWTIVAQWWMCSSCGADCEPPAPDSLAGIRHAAAIAAGARRPEAQQAAHGIVGL